MAVGFRPTGSAWLQPAARPGAWRGVGMELPGVDMVNQSAWHPHLEPVGFPHLLWPLQCQGQFFR